jgi:chromosome segregation ATPase
VFVVLGGSDRPNAQAQPTSVPSENRLYQEMQARIRYLESQVEEEREARRRADTLLARLMDRLPELEAPQETRESPETLSEPRPNTTGPPEAERPAETRPWWRRVFGG